MTVRIVESLAVLVTEVPPRQAVAGSFLRRPDRPGAALSPRMKQEQLSILSVYHIYILHIYI